MHKRFVKFGFIGCVLLSACGKGKRVDGTLVVATLQLPGTSLGIQNYEPQAMAFGDVPKSSTVFSFSKVDGIKVTLTKVRAMDANSGGALTELELNKELTLTDDPTQAIALNEAAEWAVGSYRKLEIFLSNTWQVKAYCKTALQGDGSYTLVYSAGTTVKTVSCASDSACSTLPSDYDYVTYTTLDKFYKDQSQDAMVSNNIQFTVAEGSSPKVQLLFDATNTVACWNGQNFGSLPSSISLGGFRSPSTDSDRQSRWPDGTGAFTVSGLPLIGYVSTNATEATPAARSFFTSSTSAVLNDLDDNMYNTETITILYNDAGTPVSGGGRNTSGTGSTISDILEGFEANSTAGWNFYASG